MRSDMEQPTSGTCVPFGDSSIAPLADQGCNTALERARVRARLRTEVRSALRTANRPVPRAEADTADVRHVGDALADCVRTLHSLGVSEREALSDIRISVDEVDLASRLPIDRRSLMAEAQRRLRDHYDDARA